MKAVLKIAFLVVVALAINVANAYLFRDYVAAEQTRETLGQLGGGPPVKAAPYQSVFLLELMFLTLLGVALLRREIYKILFKPEVLRSK